MRPFNVVVAGTEQEATAYCRDNGLTRENTVVVREFRTLEGLRFNKEDVVRIGSWRSLPEIEMIEELIKRGSAMMWPRPSVVPQTWDVLQEALDKISYKREEHPSGRRFSLVRNDQVNYAMLHIYSWTPDTFNPSEMRYTNHEFLVPAAEYNLLTWVRWVFDCIMKMETHEITEWFMFEGKRIYAPHHGNGWDPYSFWPGHDIAEKKKSPGQD